MLLHTYLFGLYTQQQQQQNANFHQRAGTLNVNPWKCECTLPTGDLIDMRDMQCGQFVYGIDQIRQISLQCGSGVERLSNSTSIHRARGLKKIPPVYRKFNNMEYK